MKQRIAAALLLFGLCLPALAQEHYTEGPVWRVTLIRVKPNQMDAYLATLRQSTKPQFDEEKKQGIILDYKVFIKTTKANPDDWDIAVAVQYKDFAALDGETAKGEAVRDKILGGKNQARIVGENRLAMREIVSVELMREVTLK
jgi:hypothetical protein